MAALVFVCALLAAGVAIQIACTRRDRRRLPPLGRLEHGIHVRVLGDAGPTIVFEAGLAATSLSWSVVQARLARQARTVSYDRAGLGWSAPARRPRTLRRWTDDLHALLRALDAQTPLVLVGHSFGSFIMRMYACRFPEEVAALVLIDPPVAEEFASLTVRRRVQLWRAAFFSHVTGVFAAVGVVRLGLWGLLRRGQGRPGPLGLHPTPRRIARELAKLPPDVIPALCARWSEPRFFREMAASILAMPRCAAEVLAHRLPSGLNIVVISGAHQQPEQLRAHASLASRHIVVPGSAHWVHFDRPEEVVAAIADAASLGVDGGVGRGSRGGRQTERT